MFGKRPHLDLLESRKQLLIAESELNRAQLSLEWQTMGHGVANLAHRAKIFSAWVSSALLLVAGLAAFRRGPSAPGASKLFWCKKILDGARVASTIWFAFRGRGHKQERQEP
jgi:hypothetical protein